MRSPTATSRTPSSSFNSAMSIVASPLPPMSINATAGPIATIVPSIVCPRSTRFALVDASNIAAKSSVGSLTKRSSWSFLTAVLFPEKGLQCGGPDLVSGRRHVQAIGDQQLGVRLPVGSEHLLLDIHERQVIVFRAIRLHHRVRRLDRLDPLPPADAGLDRDEDHLGLRQRRMHLLI